jgi:hypothetical protein
LGLVLENRKSGFGLPILALNAFRARFRCLKTDIGT